MERAETGPRLPHADVERCWRLCTLAHRDRAGGLLEDAGFANVSFESIDAPVTWGRTVEAAMAFWRDQPVVQDFTKDRPADAREQAMVALEALVARHHSEAGVCVPGSAWLITAHNPG